MFKEGALTSCAPSLKTIQILSLMVAIKNVSKSYDHQCVLDKIDFTIGNGEVLGLLGPNGSGKTTLLKIICGLIHPNDGKVVFSDIHFSQVGAIFDDQKFLGHLSGLKNIRLFFESLHSRNDNIEQAFKAYGLWENRHKKYKDYSTGMKKRLDLLSIFNSHKILFLLDEPMNGLDIDGMLLFEKKITELKQEGKSFIISSHYAAGLEKIGDRFLMMRNGKVVSSLKKEEVIQNFGSLENSYQSIM
jgi:ABC-2 type transport system ATP-binding protein